MESLDNRFTSQVDFNGIYYDGDWRGNGMTITGIYYDGAMIQVLWR
jgi:hypothetical protein